MSSYRSLGNGVFQQDQFHIPLLVTDWLDVHFPDFNDINLPPRQQNVNLIDLLWSDLEKCVKALATLLELWLAVADVWKVMPVFMYCIVFTYTFKQHGCY